VSQYLKNYLEGLKYGLKDLNLKVEKVKTEILRVEKKLKATKKKAKKKS
jgi:predicted  nucleic acid-binding Zn-ribbon protein